jgi:zinc protease
MSSQVNLRRLFCRLPILIVLLLLIMAPVATRSNAALRPVEQITTTSGVELWLVHEPSIPLVAVRFSFAGGALQDPRGKEGLGDLLGSLLSEGAGNMDAATFARRIANEGARLSFAIDRDQIYGGFDVLSSRLLEAMELLRTAVSSPRFDPEAIERVRSQKLAELDLALKNPRSVALDRWYAAVFADQNYGRPVHGELATLRAITRDDLLRQHNRMFTKDGLRVVIVGDVDRETAIKVVDHAFGGLQVKGDRQAIALQAPVQLSEPIIVEMNQPSATAAFGTLALPPTHPDFPALEVLRQVVGSGDFDSILMEEIRVKRGLAYAVSLSLLNDTVGSVLLGGMATKPENMPEAQRVLLDVLAQIARDGPSADPFENAKRYLTGSYLLDLDTNAHHAGSLLRAWLQGRDPGYLQERNRRIAAVALDDGKRVARETFEPSRLRRVIVEPALQRER